MEIGPVTGVRIVPMVKPKEADLGMTDVYQIERSTRTGDETYLPSKTRAATGFEDENDEYDDPEEDPETGRKAPPEAKRQIDFFA